MQLFRTDGIYEVNGVRVIVEKEKRQLPKGLSLVFQNPELQFVTNSITEELTVSFYGMQKTNPIAYRSNRYIYLTYLILFHATLISYRRVKSGV